MWGVAEPGSWSRWYVVVVLGVQHWCRMCRGVGVEGRAVRRLTTCGVLRACVRGCVHDGTRACDCVCGGHVWVCGSQRTACRSQQRAALSAWYLRWRVMRVRRVCRSVGVGRCGTWQLVTLVCGCGTWRAALVSYVGYTVVGVEGRALRSLTTRGVLRACVRGCVHDRQ